MKYMVSSEEKPQNFPIYVVHSDIDSYILLNDNTGPANDDETQTLKQDQHMNEQTAALEIMVEQSISKTVQEEKLSVSQDLELLLPSPIIVDNSSLNR